MDAYEAENKRAREREYRARLEAMVCALVTGHFNEYIDGFTVTDTAGRLIAAIDAAPVPS
jgi:hypothetical protein